MAYHVRIRDNATGEIVTARQDLPWADDGSDIYWWTDGNMGCDCNRELEFRRAKGEDPSVDDVSCGNGAYSVLDATLADGRRVPIDAPACEGE